MLVAGRMGVLEGVDVEEVGVWGDWVATVVELVDGGEVSVSTGCDDDVNEGIAVVVVTLVVCSAV